MKKQLSLISTFLIIFSVARMAEAKPEVVEVVSGRYHSCALLGDSSVQCWGRNVYGAFGSGNLISSAEPVVVIPAGFHPKPIRLFAEETRTCVIYEDHSLRCWGSNRYGALGYESHQKLIGDEYIEKAVLLPPIPLGSGVGAKKVGMGRDGTCALTLEGRIKCWGRNKYGILGLGISDNDHRLGDNHGEMGDNLPFVDIGGVATDICMGSYNACVLTDKNQIKCWGVQSLAGIGKPLGEIGSHISHMGENLLPVDLGTDEKIKKISCGNSTCVLFESGRLKCFGSNYRGLAGLGKIQAIIGDVPEEMGEALPFVDLGDDLRAIDISAGMLHNCALLETGSIKCWGDNQYGQLGLEDNQHRGRSPWHMGNNLGYSALGEFVRVAKLFSQGLKTCAVIDNQDLKCWGRIHEPGVVLDKGDELGEMQDLKPIAFK